MFFINISLDLVVKVKYCAKISIRGVLELDTYDEVILFFLSLYDTMCLGEEGGIISIVLIQKRDKTLD